MRIRRRVDDDIPVLVQVMEAARTIDRWPPHRVGPAVDLLAGTPGYLALVADEGSAAVGHVALHERSAPSVMELAADVLGADEADLAVVARLFVDPPFRHRGIASSLLQAATDAAHEREKRPILDVWTDLTEAITLYERGGWMKLGQVTFKFSPPCGPDCFHAGDSLSSFVYAAP